MLGVGLYLLVLFIELILAFSIFIYILSLLYSSFKGAPYVPTKKQALLDFLEQVPLKKDLQFLELGCGDGRVVRTAVENFNVVGTGIDINPLLVLIARFKARKLNKTITFTRKDIYSTDLAPYDVIYVFLMPEMLRKLKEKFAKECKRGVLIISHGFRIDGWDDKIKKILKREPFPTYYYHI